ncbi:hypothetical protein C8R44DRAFT_747242 [Mycena epipterygia]|nr:hypothetical protein C8R44DRAFT_747242 [Mycena epipterygia]
MGTRKASHGDISGGCRGGNREGSDQMSCTRAQGWTETRAVGRKLICRCWRNQRPDERRKAHHHRRPKRERKRSVNETGRRSKKAAISTDTARHGGRYGSRRCEGGPRRRREYSENAVQEGITRNGEKKKTATLPGMQEEEAKCDSERMKTREARIQRKKCWTSSRKDSKRTSSDGSKRLNARDKMVCDARDGARKERGGPRFEAHERRKRARKQARKQASRARSVCESSNIP